MNRTLVVLLCLPFLLSCGPSTAVHQEAAAPSAPAVGAMSQVDSLIAGMSLEQKVGQLVMVRANGIYVSADDQEVARLTRLITQRWVGGIIMAQGDVYETAMLLNRLQGLARVPLLVSSDLERGMAMRIRRSTAFGDAMQIGATADPRYAYRVGRAIAEEARAVGIHQNYAPVADVNTNPGNPVINTRSFGDDLPLVERMVGAFVRGTADGGAIATLKHFPGHGDTERDSHLELPVLPFSRRRLDSLELAPFRTGVDSGAGAVMVAHIAVPALGTGTGTPASLSPQAVEGVLRGEMQFGGLVVTDAMDMQGVRAFSTSQAVVMAVKAGVDLVLMTSDEDVALDALLRAARSGEISAQRLDASMRRILTIKQELGLFRERVVDASRISEHVATEEHRALARALARDAITVVRNEQALLPLHPGRSQRLVSVIISDVDDNRTEVSRTTNPFPNEPVGAYLTSLLQMRHRRVQTIRLSPSSNALDLKRASRTLAGADLVLYAVFVKVRTSTGRISIPDTVQAWLRRETKSSAPSVVVTFGNPYLLREFPHAAVLAASYGDAEFQVEAAIQALFGEIPVRGRLPVTIPGLAAGGMGIDLPKTALRRDEPAMAGFDAARLQRIDDIVRLAIRDSAFPCAQVAVVQNGVLAYNKAFGTYTYDPSSGEIGLSTLFDLASLTKVIATTAATMKLVDQGRLSVDDPVSRYLPPFAHGEKAAITIRHLLTHRAGFPPFRKLWEICSSPAAALDTVFATPLVARPGDTTIYSDFSMITMGKVIERITGMGLDTFVQREFYEPLGMSHTLFNPSDSLKALAAPTEIDAAWRKTLVRGVVHDENACFLGGVSGHAGLFSTSSDLALFMQMLLDGGTYGGVRYLQQKTIDLFLGTRLAGQERWLGWDMRSASGSSAGDLFSAASFGHTGFTGTSIWADPAKHLAVIFLTNRVHPTRANTKLFRVRPVLHNAVVNARTEQPTP